MSEDPTYLDKKRGTLRARLMHWTADVVLVFLGVSAAFWLNNYQQHDREAKQRDRILASLEKTLRKGIVLWTFSIGDTGVTAKTIAHWISMVDAMRPHANDVQREAVPASWTGAS